MVGYPDTSFLVSLYGRDAHSARAHQIGSALTAPLVFTTLHRHEARNACRLAVFRKEISTDECQAVLAAIDDDVKTGVLVATPVTWADVFGIGDTLSAAHTAALGTRAMDILHVAAASVLGANVFFTFDARQAALARKAGMKVKP